MMHHSHSGFGMWIPSSSTVYGGLHRFAAGGLFAGGGRFDGRAVDTDAGGGGGVPAALPDGTGACAGSGGGVSLGGGGVLAATLGSVAEAAGGALVVDRRAMTAPIPARINAATANIHGHVRRARMGIAMIGVAIPTELTCEEVS
jgi:hypothetical protein